MLRPMESAPQDGTRIILKAVTFAWSTDVCQHVATGDHFIEARWSTGMGNKEQPGWYEWCGNDRTFSTSGRLTAIGWIPRPPSADQQ